MTRRYELKQRAESKMATRRRIVEATVELHKSVGFGTTISAIAERAGVQRLTVYRHFPDERSLFEACSGHWRAENPAPDISSWAALDDPEERLRLALIETYGFFRRTEDMTGNLLRDLPHSPVLQDVAAPLLEYWQSARQALDRGWTVRGSQRKVLRAIIGHALAFETWRSLVREGLDDRGAAEAMVAAARATQADGGSTTKITRPGRTRAPSA
jgi:AcrR family transcriptional regulator